MTWTPELIVEQSVRWASSWHPPGSAHIVDAGHEFYLLDGEATLLRYHGPLTDPRAVLDETRKIVASHGATTVRITVGPGTFNDLSDDDLTACHAEIVNVLDIDALELTGSTLDTMSTPSDIDVIEVAVDDPIGLDEFSRVSLEAWGFPPPVLDDLDNDVENDSGATTPGLFVARIDGVGVATAGYALVDGVARMWGAATLPDFRGRGVYRALIAARLRDARARGATLAIVHAERTSSPILQHLGFRKYGERHLTRLSV
ncbi:GNAT family N-acetyltransferase [Gordonia sp. CPCC 205515]|uniref:GNAT family N-acetyltransferase n=1 Tax=Gordonia sp. CPCC 205515 TaxID=3140791 RepID=UPI003AF33EAE